MRIGLAALALVLSACSGSTDSSTSTRGAGTRGNTSAAGSSTSGGGTTSGTSGGSTTGSTTSSAGTTTTGSACMGSDAMFAATQYMPSVTSAVQASETSNVITVAIADQLTSLCGGGMASTGEVIDLFIPVPDSTPTVYTVSDGGPTLATLERFQSMHNMDGGTMGGDAISGNVTVLGYDSTVEITGSFELRFPGGDYEQATFTALPCSPCE